VHGWFGSPLFTSPKASGVLIALQKLFFGLRLPFCRLGNSRNTSQILPPCAKAAGTATLRPRHNQTGFLIGFQNFTGFSKKEQGFHCSFLFWEQSIKIYLAKC
jgi:hypothetical protein